jgi:hypothetical protein
VIAVLQDSGPALWKKSWTLILVPVEHLSSLP